MSAVLDAVLVGFGNRAKSLVGRLGEQTGIRAGGPDQADDAEAPTVEAVFEAQRLVEGIYAACGLPKTRRSKTWVRES